jgi:hypothetical protein
MTPPFYFTHDDVIDMRRRGFHAADARFSLIALAVRRAACRQSVRDVCFDALPHHAHSAPRKEALIHQDLTMRHDDARERDELRETPCRDKTCRRADNRYARMRVIVPKRCCF